MKHAANDGPQSECFLCDIPRDLLFAESDDAFALSGLGPILEGYSVVAAREHIASAAESSNGSNGLIEFAESIRSFLGRRYNGCLLTEHGRMPACVGPAGAADSHCFHAHFLLFPAAPSIIGEAGKYFASKKDFPNLSAALESARDGAEYFLISPDAGSASILTRPGRLIPQFARMLVAEAVGRPQLANWRKAPSRDKCVAAAESLRGAIGNLR